MSENNNSQKQEEVFEENNDINADLPEVEFVDPSDVEVETEEIELPNTTTNIPADAPTNIPTNIPVDIPDDVPDDVPVGAIEDIINTPVAEDVKEKPENQIKEIILDTKSNNENNNFGETLTVSKLEVIPKYETKLGHEMFLRIMENDMLRDVPVALQSNKIVQEEIRKKAERIYVLKEEGDKILTKEKEDGYKHIQFVEYLKEGNFDKVKWVYPVVFDQHVIYALRCEEKKKLNENNLNNNDDEEENTSGEVPYGDKMEDQFSQMKEIQSLYKKLGKGEINIVSFFTNMREQTEPYKPPPDTFWNTGDVPKAKQIRMSEYAELYRYINLNNKRKMKNRVGKGPTVIPLSVPEKKEKVESFIDDVNVERKSITVDSGETIDIVGFLFIPENINTSTNNNTPYKTDEEIYNKWPLIKEAFKRKIIIKSDNGNIPSLELDKPSLLLFENALDQNNRNVTPEKYIEMLRKIIPSPDEVIDFIIKTNDDLNIYNFNQKLRKWGYKLGTITYDSWKKAKDVIVENVKKEKPKTVTGIKLEDIGKVCEVSEEELLRDSQFHSKLMRLIYSPDLNYTSDVSKYFRGKNCALQRTNILFNTDDNGAFYYTHSFFHMRNKIAENIKRLEKIKKVLIKEIEPVKTEKIPTDDINKELENTNINILKLKEEFNKLNKISSKNYNAIIKLKQNEKLVEQINKTIKDYDNRIKDFRKLLKNEAGLLVLHYMAKVIEKLDKTRLSDALLGKILHNKESETINKKQSFALLEETPPALQSVINQINQITSYADKKQLLYTIIQLDGIIVDKYIYSIFYGKPLICGHWYYLMLIDNSDTETERQKWVTEFLSIYGDSGDASRGEENCIICGSFLDRTSLVESMFIDQWGNPLKIREAYEEERRRTTYLHSLPLNTYDTIAVGVKNCNGDEFKNTLKRRKIVDKEEIKKAKLACELIDGMSSKMDINIASRHFIELVIVCVRESKKIAGFEAYLSEKIKELRIKKKLSENKALRLSESSKFINKVLKSYYGYFMVRYGTLILAHLLWYLRTSIPQYIPGNNATTSCSFFGFDEDNGFDYFMCIVVQMKVLRVKVTIDGVTVNESIPKHKIVKNLRYWTQSLEPNYSYALLKRKAYEKDNELFNVRVGSNRFDRVDNPFNWGEGDIKELESGEELIKRFRDVLKGNEPNVYNEIYNNVIFEIRKRVFKIRDFLNNFANNAPKTDFEQIQVTCCEELIQERPGDESIYIDYFEPIDSTIVKMADDLPKLQIQFNMLNNFLMTTHYMVSTYQIPVYNMNYVPINTLDTPDGFIKNAFEVYCHDGVSRGEHHSFDNEDFPDIERCVKCGWFLKKIQENDFSREEYVNLLSDVDLKSLRDFKTIKTKRSRLNLVSLKRSSPADKIRADIEKLAKRIARKSFSGRTSEKEVINEVENFLRNMDNFKNFIPDPEGIEATDKNKIQTIIRRNKFAIQKMKEYINEYFRKNVARIKWGYKIKSNIDTSWIPKKDEEKWQKILVDKNAWLEPFLTKTNEKLFKKFRFSFSIDNINSIIGVNPRYDSSYKSFIMSSNFDLNDALRLLKHYFIKEMLLFLDLAGPGEPILADFYLKLFNEIKQDKLVINLPEKEITKWTDTMHEDNNIIRVKYFDAIKEEGSLFNSPFRKFTDDIYSDPIFNPKLVTKDEAEQEQADAEKVENEEFLKEQAEAELGEEANEQSVEDYVQEALEDELIEEEVNEEVYNNHIKKEGEDIMDVGYDYGDQAQGIENEGDGFNDYSMNEIWEPVHEINVQA